MSKKILLKSLVLTAVCVFGTITAETPKEDIGAISKKSKSQCISLNKNPKAYNSYLASLIIERNNTIQRINELNEGIKKPGVTQSQMDNIHTECERKKKDFNAKKDNLDTKYNDANNNIQACSLDWGKSVMVFPTAVNESGLKKIDTQCQKPVTLTSEVQHPD